MKKLFICLTLLVAVPFMYAQSAGAKAGTGAKAGAAEEEEEEGTIEGQPLNRPNGHFLGLTLTDGKFKLTFYDKKKKPEKVDVDRIMARWVYPMKAQHERTVLNPAGDGTYMMGVRFVQAPHTFKLYLTLLRGEGDATETVESHTVDFKN